MFISPKFAVFWLLALLSPMSDTEAAPLDLRNQESFGLKSIDDFCCNEGRLDDLKDLAADVYRIETARFYVVSIAKND